MVTTRSRDGARRAFKPRFASEMRNEERIAAHLARAAELRAEADAMSDLESRQLVREIAQRYDRLAARLKTKNSQ